MHKYIIILCYLISMIVVVPTSSSLNAKHRYLDAKVKQELTTKFEEILKWNSKHRSALFQINWFQSKIQDFQLSQINEAVGKDDLYLNMDKKHNAAMILLRDILLAEERVEAVLKLAEAFRDHPQINSKLWLQAFISAKLIRTDMQFLRMPELPLVAPDYFLPREIFESRTVLAKEECIILDETFTDNNGAENALWYFREDFMLNAHHYFWHIYYSGNGFPEFRDRVDRRAELFAFMHHEFIARYNTARMTAGLPKTEPLIYDYVTPMVPYDPHLTEQNSAGWGVRPENSTFSELDNGSIDVQASLQILLHKDAQSGALTAENGTIVELDGFHGIEILCDEVEPSFWSLNPDRYGGFHNAGHTLVAFSPAGAKMGVMMSTGTSMRDPIFYQHHLAVENIFLEHKNSLTPYSPSGSEFPLKWDGVHITSIQVISEENNTTPNSLQTFWNHKEYNYSHGLDNGYDSPPVVVCAKHLDHVEFDYVINLESQLSIKENGTIHVFLAPRHDENSNRFSMEEQHTLFFLLDQFPITVLPGQNNIVRNSRNSSLTIPFQDFLEDGNGQPDVPQYCGCGLPHYLLLPIGSPSGSIFDLFIMVTKGIVDSQVLEENNEDNCGVAPIWCGLRGLNYPSRLPLGYPFDRRPFSVEDPSGKYRVIVNLEEYVAGISNTNTVQVNIQHIEQEKY